MGFIHRPYTHRDVIEKEAAEVKASKTFFEIRLAIPKGNSRDRTTQHIGIMVVQPWRSLLLGRDNLPFPVRDPEKGQYGWLYLPVEHDGKMRIERHGARIEDFREGNDHLEILDPEDYRLFDRLCMRSEIPDLSDSRAAWAVSIAVRLFLEEKRFRGRKLMEDGWVKQLSQTLCTKSGKILRQSLAECLERRRKRRRLGIHEDRFEGSDSLDCVTPAISDDEIDSDESDGDCSDVYDPDDGLEDYELEDELIDFWHLISE